jgi:uncharacterized protein (TIGR02246 family)
MQLTADTEIAVRLNRNKHDIERLYHELIESWDKAKARDYANLFAEDANVIGFDGSTMNGRKEIFEHINSIFNNHKTGKYVTIVKEVRFLSPDIGILQAITGLIPAGKDELEPKTNAIQTMVAEKEEDEWHIALFQNTPAQFHGRPDLAEAMTKELREKLKSDR